MTADDDLPPETLGTADAGRDDDPGTTSLWWALHRPETYAIAAFSVGLLAFLGINVAYQVVQAYMIGGGSPRVGVGVPGAILAGLGLVSLGLATMSVRAEDEDVTWSAPLARAAMIVAVLGVAFGLATVIGAATTDARIPGFNAPG